MAQLIVKCAVIKIDHAFKNVPEDVFNNVNIMLWLLCRRDGTVGCWTPRLLLRALHMHNSSLTMTMTML